MGGDGAAEATPGDETVAGYIEDMLLQLAEMASEGGQTALAASLALTAIQAGSWRQALAGSAASHASTGRRGIPHSPCAQRP